MKKKWLKVLVILQLTACSANTSLVSSSTSEETLCGSPFSVTEDFVTGITDLSFTNADGDNLISTDLAAFHWYVDDSGILTDELIIAGTDGYYYVVSGGESDGFLGGQTSSSDYADFLLSVDVGDTQVFSSDTYPPQLRLYTLEDGLSFAELESCAYGYIFESGYSQCPESEAYALGHEATMTITRLAEKTFSVILYTAETPVFDGDGDRGAYTLSYTATLEEQEVSANPPEMTRSCDIKVYSCGSGVFTTDCTCPEDGYSVTDSEGCEDGGLCSYTQITCEQCVLIDEDDNIIDTEDEAYINEKSSYCLSSTSTNFGHINLLE